MRCRAVLTRIDALRTGELPAPESTEVNEHLRTCRSCDESTNDLTALTVGLKETCIDPPRSIRDEISDQFDVIKAGGDEVLVAFSDRGLRMITTGASPEEFRETYARKFGRDIKRGTLPDRLRKQVVAALSGEGVARPVVDFADASEFEKKVMEVLTHIPCGEVRTYTWVAQQAGRPKAVRAVGNICAHNVVPFVVPCHRVVPTSGGVGNYAFGSSVKRALLKREGVPVDKLDELARRRVRYIGSKTTKVFCFPTCPGALRIYEENRMGFRDERDAASQGFRPCKRCQPVAA